MDAYDFQHAGYLTKERLCDSTRTRLTSSYRDKVYGVSIPNKIRGLYYNYAIEHHIVEKDFFWKVDDFFGNAIKDSWDINVSFLPHEIKILEHLIDSLYYYTEKSVLEALSSTPELAFFIKNPYSDIVYKDKKIHLSKHHIFIFHSNLGPKYPEYCEDTDSEALFSYAKLISTQLRTMNLDASKLVKKPQETPLLPKWLHNTINFGVKIGIKYICATIGAKIDLPDIGGDDSNNGPDINFGNGFDGGGFGDGNGFDGGGFGDGNGFDGGGFGDGNGFNFDGDGQDGGDSGIDIGAFSFKGKHFDGYEDLNKTISVPKMGGGGNDTLHVYRKHGSSTIFLSDGSCYPVPILGHEWIKVGSHKFEVSKIKSKL